MDDVTIGIDIGTTSVKAVVADADRIVAGAGIDTVHGGLGMDYIYSTDLVDEIVDDEDGYEIVLSPAVVVSEVGPDPGDDWAWVDVSQTVVIDVLDNDQDPNEDLYGNSHADRIFGGDGEDILDSQGDNDELHGGPGNDTLDGGNGIDHLAGGDDTNTCTRGETIARCSNQRLRP